MNNQPFYSVTQVVWAKIRGYPWWPAIISNIEDTDEEDIRYKVNFFGDTTHSILDETKISKFQENYTQFQANGRSNKKLAKSIQQAQEHLNQKKVQLNLIKKLPKIKLSNSRKQSNISKISKSIQGNSSDLLLKESVSKQLEGRQGSQSLKIFSPPKPPKKQQPKRKQIVQQKISESSESIEESQQECVRPTRARQNYQNESKKIQMKNINNNKLQIPKSKEFSEKKSKPQESNKSILSQKIMLKIDLKLEAEKRQRSQKIRDLIEDVKKYASDPQQVLDYLNSMDINTQNIREILDCQVIDILNSIHTPASDELISKMRTTIENRYFNQQTQNKVKPKAEKEKIQKVVKKSKFKKPLIRQQTIQKIEEYLKDSHYNLKKQKVSQEARKFQQLIFQKDKTCQEQYQQHVNVLLDQLQLKKYTIRGLMDLINALALIKQSF